MAGSDLGPNMIEIPVSRTEAKNELDTAEQNETPKAPNARTANTGHKKSRWWPF